MLLLRALVAQEPEEHAAAGGHEVLWIVEQVNHLLGVAAFKLEAVIMPPIYHIFKATWPGEGMSAEQYMAAGRLPIPTHVVMFIFVAITSVVVLAILRGTMSVESPTTRQQSFEVGVEAIRDLLKDLVGPHGLKYFPVVATFAVLILLSNLWGLLPGMVAPTANFNVTLALGLTSFLYYNYIGIKENGFLGHVRHLMGPVPAIAFMMLPIELISNMARILSLSMRLFGNIYGEEQVSETIAKLVPFVAPAMLMAFGLFTSVLQTFIFIVLSMVYIGEVSHGEHEHAGGHESPSPAH